LGERIQSHQRILLYQPARKHAQRVDINLPDLSEKECVRRLKPLMPETHFMMLTV
jgi:hypothetical protein